MPKSDEMQKLYTRYTGNSIASVPETQVNTTAGILNVYKSQDPGQPGVVVMLQPQGYEDEIDCAYVSVYENPEYRTVDKENNTDVVIMSYGDATTEDYTTKEIIRRTDIITGLGTASHVI